MSSKFSNKNLDIIKQNFDALRDNDSIKAFEANLQYKSLVKSKYLYTINFALNNKTSQVAPYIALTEVYDARLKYLDTIYTSLPDSIATSKYGKELKSLIERGERIQHHHVITTPFEMIDPFKGIGQHIDRCTKLIQLALEHAGGQHVGVDDENSFFIHNHQARSQRIMFS